LVFERAAFIQTPNQINEYGSDLQSAEVFFSHFFKRLPLLVHLYLLNVCLFTLTLKQAIVQVKTRKTEINYDEENKSKYLKHV